MRGLALLTNGPDAAEDLQMAVSAARAVQAAHLGEPRAVTLAYPVADGLPEGVPAWTQVVSPRELGAAVVGVSELAQRMARLRA